MFNFSVKGFLGYGSPKESHQEFHSNERDGFLLAAAQGQSGDLQERPEMTEAKRAKVTEQLSIVNTREVPNTKERTSLDIRRKDSVRGQTIVFSLSKGQTISHDVRIT